MFAALGRKKKAVKGYSDWMSQLPAELHNVPLYDLAIPGSHDSMSYDLDIRSPIIEPDGLKRLSWIYCARKIVRRWAITQEDTIEKQLDAGVRYFDLRIARKANDTNPTRLYFCHGLCTRTDVETVLKVFNDWAEKHPKEILILAFCHFKGFNNNQHLHNHLMGFIKTLFGAKLRKRVSRNDPIPTLKNCWDKGTNVIVSYDYAKNRPPEMWTKIPYFYGNTMETAKVESALRHVLETARPYQYFFVCGLNVTLPEDARILRYILRICDNFVNVLQRKMPKLLQWLKQQADKTPMNIVASDVVTRGNFISTVVNFNTSKKVKA